MTRVVIGKCKFHSLSNLRQNPEVAEKPKNDMTLEVLCEWFVWVTFNGYPNSHKERLSGYGFPPEYKKEFVKRLSKDLYNDIINHAYN